jgi:hypothetical protein
MIKQMMKLAGARNERDFLKMFPTEASFLKKHGGELLYMYGGSYADGGMTPQDQQAMMMMQQQAAAQQQGQPSQDQMMQQIVQFIMQALQQGAAPEEILQKLVEQGIPEQQATQIIQAVLQKAEQEQGAAQGQQPGMEQQMSPEEQQMMMQQQQGQQQMGGMAYGGVAGTPEEEGMENQPVMRRGGTPCYKCGGKYKNGGSYSGTYSNGVYYANGGPYVPTYGDIMNAQFGQDGAGELIPPGSPSTTPAFKYGGSRQYKKGGEYEMTQNEIQDLINKGYKIQYV